MPYCGVQYLWFAFVCFLIKSHPPNSFLNRPRSPPTQWVDKPPFHAWKIPSSKGEHVRTPGISTNRYTHSAFMATPPPPWVPECALDMPNSSKHHRSPRQTKPEGLCERIPRVETSVHPRGGGRARSLYATPPSRPPPPPGFER